MENPNPSKDFYLPQIADKLQFLQECIHQVESQLRSRKTQRQQFETEIQEQTLEIRNRILHLEEIGDIRVPKNPSRKAALEVEIQKLDKEKRQQELEYWRDVTALQKELRQLKKEYRAVRAGASQSKCSTQKN